MFLSKLIGTATCLLVVFVATSWTGFQRAEGQERPANEADLLYVAVPAAVALPPDALGSGILVFDVKNNWRFVKRIPLFDDPPGKEQELVKGIVASPETGILYVATLNRASRSGRMIAFDLVAEKKLWDNDYGHNCCDRMALSPDGKTMYIPGKPNREQWHGWFIVDALTGKLIKTLTTHDPGSHNSIWSLDGSRVFLSGAQGKIVAVADPTTHTIVHTVGPFSAPVKPFTINGRGTLLFANMNDLLGFEVADIKTGKVLHHVEVTGFGWPEKFKGKDWAHSTPSHGIALTPDEKEIWLVDELNHQMHVFDATVMPPKQGKSVKLRHGPSWVTVGFDGKYIYPSSGDVVDAAQKKVVGGLFDEKGRSVQSEKLVEILFVGGKPVRAVNQFGVGLVRTAESSQNR